MSAGKKVNDGLKLHNTRINIIMHTAACEFDFAFTNYNNSLSSLASRMGTCAM